MELVNNRIANYNHPTETSSLKTTFFKNRLQHIHDQFVNAPVDIANGNAAYIYKRFYIEA